MPYAYLLFEKKKKLVKILIECDNYLNERDYKGWTRINWSSESIKS